MRRARPRLPRALVRAAARMRPLVPERAWPILHSARSLAGPGPIVGLPAFRRLLVVAPHPDDEAVGCGGLIALLADRGAAVTVAFATQGGATVGAPFGPDEVVRRRRAEAEDSCRILGATARFLDHADGGLTAARTALTADLRDLLGELDPEAVVLPWFGDGHPDHKAVNDALLGADPAAEVEVWGAETWTPAPANRIVDITPVLERKRAAIAAHETAHLAFDVSAILGLNRYRSINGLAGHGHAEAFVAAPVETYRRLARDLDLERARAGR